MASRRRKPIGLADALRRRTKASGLSTYMVAKRAGLPVSGVQRFMGKPKAQIYTDTAEAIASALGLQIELKPAKGR